MRVFISHTAHDPRDCELARRLKEAVIDIGGQAWIAPDDIPAGEHWRERVESAILVESTHFLAVLSAAAVASEWVPKEVEMALQRHDSDLSYPILLLKIGYLPPYTLATRVEEFQSIPYYDDIYQQAKALRACLREKESRSSTGAAVEAIADDLIGQIESGQIQSIDQMEAAAQKLALSIRGRMISFGHFFKIGQGYALDSWPSGREISKYIGDFRRYTREANERVGRQLVDFLGTTRTRVCISEYSRAIFAGLKERVKSQPPLDIIFIIRGDRAEVPEELFAARDYLNNLGLPPATTLSVEEWLSFLEEMKAGRQRVDVLLFGAEAVTPNGDVVFPQLLTDDELNLLREIAASHRTELVCVVEGYKFLDDCALNSVKKISNFARYKILPATLWSCFVTDGEVLHQRPDGRVPTEASRRRVLRECRTILNTLVPTLGMRPFSHMADHQLVDVAYLIADIDHTITTEDCVIPSFVVRDLERLAQANVSVLLVTGRSAGWSAALSVYLPGIVAIVCENGLIMTDRRGCLSILAGEGMQQLALTQIEENANRVAGEYGLSPTDDSPFRLLERTFVRPVGFGSTELARSNQLVAANFEVIASSIHIHVRPRGWDKADGVRAALKMFQPNLTDAVTNLIVVGDSANDVPLFRDFEEVSIGVANVCDLISELGGHVPRFLTKARHANGFHEIVTRILESKGLVN